MHVERFTSFSQLPAAAQALTEASLSVNPFVSAPWLQCFERYLVREDESLRYLVVRDQQRVLAVLPLVLKHMPLFGVQKVRGMTNFYTGIFNCLSNAAIASPAAHEALAVGVAAALKAEFPHVGLIEFAPLRDHSGFMPCLERSLHTYGYRTRHYLAHANWYEDLDGRDFAAYMADRPGRVRSTLDRKSKSLARELGYEVQVCAEPADISSCMGEYHAVYAASWKNTEYSPAFIEDIMVRMSAAGIVKLGILRAGGQAAAVQIWIKIGLTWAVFKLAYDPRFDRYSVGSILTARLIENFLMTGPCAGLDFLSGDDAYKQEWATRRREHWGLEAVAMHNVMGIAIRAKRYLKGVALTT